MSVPPIRLVCFDLGGVVLRICHTWPEGCAAAGLDVRADVDAICRAPDVWPSLHDDYQCGRMSVEAYAEHFSRLTGGVYTAGEILRIHDAWIRGEYEGVAGVVDALHASGLETAVLSNTCAAHWAQMPQYEAFRVLRNRLGSHLLATRKPDPAAYRAVEAHTGRTGREILFFDDYEENVAAARARGWRAEVIDPHASPAEQIGKALSAHGVVGIAT